MLYTSTRNAALRVTASQAILQGISEDGGLFVPTEFPQADLASLKELDYCALVAEILSLYLTDYSKDFLLQAATAAYGQGRFEGKTAQIVKLQQGLYSMELWHGPTSAFKDYALQLMPRLLVEAKRINNETRTTKILVATSGDTGKAALEGYKDLPGISIAVFYPDHGTSEIQRLQMTTQQGDNVAVFAVKGNFDDAQTGVKKVFTDAALAKELDQQHQHLTSANSINWGRLVPQIVYYFAGYFNLVKAKEIPLGETVDFCVPTGNFGDILAGYYAKRMGLPVGRLLCASNANNVLTDFGRTGVYDANRPFYKTASPSMDILVSSNFERLLYHESEDSQMVAQLMQALAGGHRYEVPQSVYDKILANFGFACTPEEACFAEIGEAFRSAHYLLDPHTAVATAAARKAGGGPCVVLSTASPYKFSPTVLAAVGGKCTGDDFADLAALEECTGTTAPAALRALRQLPVRFSRVIEPAEIAAVARTL